MLLDLLESLAVGLVGLLAGVHMTGSLALNPVLRALDPPTYITVKQACDERFPAMARPLMLSCLGTTALVAVMAGMLGHPASAALAAVALAALGATLLAILRGDLPLNRQMAAWSSAGPPAELAQVLARWERFFTVRTVSSVAALVLLLAAAQAGR